MTEAGVAAALGSLIPLGVMIPQKVAAVEVDLVDIQRDIQPITTFRNHSTEFLAHIKATQRPLILTVNGKAAAVVQDAEAYQRLLDLAAEGAASEGIRQGLEDLASERVRLAGEVSSDLRARHGISR